MIKKIFQIIGIVVGCAAIGLVLDYSLVAGYFNKHFAPGTYINDHYVTGMTVEEASDLLARDYNDYSLKISEAEGNEEIIAGSDIGFSADYSEDVREIMNAQRSSVWPAYFESVRKNSAEADFAYDENKLNAKLEETKLFTEYPDNSEASVSVDEIVGVYVLNDETVNKVKTDDALSVIKSSLEAGDVDTSVTNCYYPRSYTAEQHASLNLYKKLEQYQATEIVYKDENVSQRLDFTTTNKWLIKDDKGIPKLDENGELMIDEEKVREFVTKLSSTFNTADGKLNWIKKSGDTVELPYNGTGYTVDEEEEVRRIMANLPKGKKIERTPSYVTKGLGRQKADVGDTYVEVDLGNQKLYFYKNGKLTLQSDVVSGNINRGNDTPEMITDIYFMQEGRTLRGANYATFVYYWMAFYNHYGLHDATWRSKFGDDIYKHDGSHGCVNLPKDFAGQLYKEVSVGTPVILYY